MTQLLTETEHSIARCHVMTPPSGEKNCGSSMKNYKYACGCNVIVQLSLDTCVYINGPSFFQCTSYCFFFIVEWSFITKHRIGTVQGTVAQRFRMVLRGTIHNLRHFHWSFPRSADSTANKMTQFMYCPA